MNATALKRTSLIAILTLLALTGLSSGCTRTIIPPSVRDSGASFDGGQKDSGFRGWYTNSNGAVFAVMSPKAHDRYNALVSKFGNQYPVPLKNNDGTQSFTNGTWLIDSEHDVKFREMNGWSKSGL